MKYKTCTYCGLKIKSSNPKKTTHKLCDQLKEISSGRNLTYANKDGYPMSYIGGNKDFSNLHPNSRDYCYTHEVVAQLLLGRKLKTQSNSSMDEAEIVDHIRGAKSKKNFAPYNLRVMKLKDHVHSHKFEHGSKRKYKD